MKVFEILEKQIAEAGSSDPAAAVGQLLLAICHQSRTAAQLVEQDLQNKEMDIKHCYQTLYKHANEHKSGQVYAMPPQEAERLVCQFYGIPLENELQVGRAAPHDNIIDLNDLLDKL